MRYLRPSTSLMLMLLVLLRLPTSAQQDSSRAPTSNRDDDELKVNWLYGSFVPKDVPVIPLTSRQRWTLYTRMTYTTYGIYIKTGLFTMSDQIRDVPPEWEKTPEGFGQRLGTREAQFVIQNSLTAMGNAALSWETRYDRCRCDASGRELGTPLRGISSPMEEQTRAYGHRSCPMQELLGLR